MTVNTPDVIFEFSHGISDTSVVHMGSTFVLTVICILVIASLICFVLDKVEVTVILLLLTIPLMLYDTAVFVASKANTETHIRERLYTVVNEHQDDFDNAVNTWLNDHGLDRDELCSSRIVMDASTMEIIDTKDTLVCGRNKHNVKPGIFVLDDRDGVVFAGENNDSVIMMYQEKDNNARNRTRTPLYGPTPYQAQSMLRL